MVWFGVSLNLRVNRSEITSWARWLLQMYESANGEKELRNHMMSYIAITCWHIWKARCNFQFNQIPISPSQVLAAISHSSTTFRDAWSTQTTPEVPNHIEASIVVGWSPPFAVSWRLMWMPAGVHRTARDSRVQWLEMRKADSWPPAGLKRKPQAWQWWRRTQRGWAIGKPSRLLRDVFWVVASKIAAGLGLQDRPMLQRTFWLRSVVRRHVILRGSIEPHPPRFMFCVTTDFPARINRVGSARGDVVALGAAS